MHVASTSKYFLTRTFLNVVFDYPFNQLGCKKIIATVNSDNEKARNLNEKLGFVLECKIIDAVKSGDLLIYTMNKDNCKFIGGTYGRSRVVLQ